MDKTASFSKSDFYQKISDIDFALVEDVRPPMYKGLKYWGKKPHNIWSKYIENYVAEGDIVLDIFAGSGVCALEAIQIGRRVISVDLNPLSKFIVEFLISDFDEKEFISAARSIIDKTNQYLKEIDQFETTCIKC
jgi:adenine-specific DNA methylase